MKKLMIYLSLLLLVLPGYAKNIHAEEPFDYDIKYDVVFTADEKIEYRNEEGNVVTDLAEDLPDMLPGDSMRLTFNIKNEYKSSVDWYMYNNSEAFETLSAIAADAAYDYELTYTGKSAPLYSSDIVGGDEMTGIEEATDALKEYFLLHQGFSKGQNESVTLELTLDGETQVNTYQDALGKVKFRFAVEIPPEPTKKREEKIIYIPDTGDHLNVNFYIIAEALSLILLAVALYAYYRYLRNEKGA